MNDRETVTRQLLAMAAELGDDREMAILGEGNISGQVDEQRFLVKASGTQLSDLQPHQLVEVDAGPLLEVMKRPVELSDHQMEQLLMNVRVNAEALKPSVETLFHAWLLRLPGVDYVGHTHAVAVNQLLCSPAAADFATQRLFPDQVVYCGAESVLVPYVDPGLPLARSIGAEVEAFWERTGGLPQTILLENHGIIAVGERPGQVTAALAMAEKAARIFVGAAALGGPVFMTPRHVERISGRRDEHYRQRMME